MKIMLGAALLLVCGSALADTAQQGKIVRFVVEGNYASIWLENQPTNNECPADGRWVIDFSADSIAKEKYSAILTAASTRTPVVLHYATSEGCSAFGAKRVQYIDLSY